MTGQSLTHQADTLELKDPRVYAESAYAFGIRLTDTELEDYCLTLAGMSVLDDILDQPTDTHTVRANHQLHLDAIADHRPEDLAHDPGNILGRYALRLAQWSPDKQYHHLHHLNAIGDIAVRKRQTDSVWHLFMLLKEEGRRFGSIFMPDQSPDRDTRAFDRFLDNAGICALLADTAWDLKTDYAEGLTRVKPTRANQAYLMARMTPYARQVLRTGSPRQNVLLGQVTRGAILQIGSRKSKAQLEPLT